MRLLCSEQQQMMSGNNTLPVSMATSAIHSPPFSTQAGREGGMGGGGRGVDPFHHTVNGQGADYDDDDGEQF